MRLLEYAELMAELRRLAALATDLSFVSDAAQRIEASGALKLASRVRTTPVSDSGEDTVFHITWRDATELGSCAHASGQH